MIPRWLVVICTLGALAGPAQGQSVRVAAAADLKFAMDEVITTFRVANPDGKVEAVYGSSGKFHAQIEQGAPYDLYFSADIDHPRQLAAKGMAAGAVTPYAIGRIVLWSANMDASRMTLASLGDPAIRRIAIANPKHAPYGRRAEEALRSAGVWPKIEPKLVYGENIAQTAQFVLSGNAQVGVIALALAIHPELASKGGYWLIPSHLHAPLEQGFVVTRRASDNQQAWRLARFMASPTARAIMSRHGFSLPDGASSP